MKSSMVIIQDSGNREHCICSCTTCKPNLDDPMEIYYSYGHAIANGWVNTNNIKYCPPKVNNVWVCKDCYEICNT